MLNIDAVVATEDVMTESRMRDCFVRDVTGVVRCLHARVTLAQRARVRAEGKQVEAGVPRQ